MLNVFNPPLYASLWNNFYDANSACINITFDDEEYNLYTASSNSRIFVIQCLLVSYRNQKINSLHYNSLHSCGALMALSFTDNYCYQLIEKD